MGCCNSRSEREEMVTRCRARKRYMKQFVKARQNFSASHSMYLRSLRTTGSALLRFATAELEHHHAPLHAHHTPTQMPPPMWMSSTGSSAQAPPEPRASHSPSQFCHEPPLRLPMSPTSLSWTASTAASTSQPPPPPPFYRVPPWPRQRQVFMRPASISWTTSTTASTLKPPPPPPPATEGSMWDFWEPFMPGTETEEWEEGTGSSTVRAPAMVTGAPSAVSGIWKEDTSARGSELAMVVSGKSKNLVEIIKELDDYFLKAAEAGAHVSYLLEVPSSVFSDPRSTAKVYGEGKSLSPLMWSFGSCRKLDGFGNCGDNMIGNNCLSYGDDRTFSHHSTVERLYAWEKKLYHEVKKAHELKMDHEKRTTQLRKLELKRAKYVKTEQTKKEIAKLESRIMVASQAIETTSAEVIKIRESELCPQLIELVKGLVGMWRSLYEFHHVQTHIVKQLKYINTIPSTDPTSEIHRQSTLQLELEVQQWHLSFCHLIKCQRDYIQSLTGWLRLSLFQFAPLTKTPQDSLICSLSEEWQLSIDRIPDEVASEGIKNFLTVIHAIVVQHGGEQKQKKKSEAAFRELEKKAGELRSIESKYDSYAKAENSIKDKDLIVMKRAKVEALRAKAEEEKAKHEKAVSVTRVMTMNNLQMGLPHVFEAVTGFANVCITAFEAVYNKANSEDEFHNVKRLLP